MEMMMQTTIGEKNLALSEKIWKSRKRSSRDQAKIDA